MDGEHRGHPLVAYLITAATLVLAVGVFLGTFADIAGTGNPKTAGGLAEGSIRLFLLLVGGLWCARGVGTGYWWRRPDPSRVALAPAPIPAAFIACFGCGRQVNRQVGHCPYCQTVVEGGADG